MITPSTARIRNSNSQGILDSSEELSKPMYSEEAEKAVLGSMLARPDIVVDEVSDVLKRDDFFVPAHQEVFEAIQTLHNNGKAIDITTLHDYLTVKKLADVVGSPGILAELAAGLATHLNVGSYIAIVKDKSLLRHLQHACAEIVTDVASGECSVSEVLNRAEARIFALNDCQKAARVTDMHTGVTAALERLRELSERPNRLVGISTGLNQLNAYTNGWRGGQMIVVAARPGKGKTALAWGFGKAAAERRWDEAQEREVEPGHPVHIFSAEMSADELMERALADACSVEMNRLQTGDVKEELQKIETMAWERVARWPITIDDSSGLSLSTIRSRSRRAVRERGVKLIIIDYLQLLLPDVESKNREREVAEMSRGIKQLAKELDIPIIVLAQLSRKCEEENREPKPSDLRESGSIEQDADKIIFIHWFKDGTFGLLIRKQRGGIGWVDVPVKWDGCYQRFSDVGQNHVSKPRAPAPGEYGNTNWQSD